MTNYTVLTRLKDGVYVTDQCEGWPSTVATMGFRRYQGNVLDWRRLDD